MSDKCMICGEEIAENKVVCNSCEKVIIKVGTIMQSNGATAEEMKKALESLIREKEMSEEEVHE